MKKYSILILFIAINVPLFAGPFGLEMGWSVEQCINAGATINLDDIVIKGPSRSYIVIPSKKHPTFTTYYCSFDDEYGLYKIQTFSDEYSVYKGASIKSDFETIKSQIGKSYGEPTKMVDNLKSNSFWKSDDNWAQSIAYGDRVYGSEWNLKSQEPLKNVRLIVGANDLSTLILYLEYESDKNDLVEEKINNFQSTVF